MSLILLENISLCTGVLGLFLVFPLIALARKRPASMWLALYVFTISAAALEDYSRFLQLRWIYGMSWPNLAVDVLYYCYVRSLTGLGNGRFQSIHFVPLALYLAAALVALLPGSAFAPAFARWEHGAWASSAYQCQGLFYLCAVLYRLRQHRLRVQASGGASGHNDLRWLTTLSYVLAALWISWVLAVRLHGNWNAVFTVGRLATFYFVGWYGLRRAAVFVPPPAPAAAPDPRPAPAAEPLPARRAEPLSVAAPAAGPAAQSAPGPAAADQAEQESAEREKYARSGMTEATQRLIGERLQRRMAQQRDYLESDLRLNELAERIGTTPQLLSQYLNHMLGLSFFDYINGLRIAEVQTMMCTPLHAGRTLLELAHAAGFNSKSTFNTAFKNSSGMAPSQWRARHAREAPQMAALLAEREAEPEAAPAPVRVHGGR
jgi:AraC-like DNA-binding protein